jgi:hypothetical protein
MKEQKVFKGYRICGGGEFTEAVFETNEIYKSVEEFYNDSINECFKNWYKETLEEDEGLFLELSKEDQLKYFISYNVDDDLGMFYDFDDIDNVEKMIKEYNCNTSEELVVKFEEIENEAYANEAEERYNNDMKLNY